MRNKIVSFSLVLLALSASGSSQAPPSSATRMLFSAKAVSPDKQGKPKSLHMSISRMRLESEEDEWQNIPIADFSIMTVYSGRVETMMDGQTVVRGAGDYWTVKGGSVLKERVLGESAILQIVAVKK